MKKILFIYAGPDNVYDQQFKIHKSLLRKFIANSLNFPKSWTFPILASLTPDYYDIEVIDGQKKDINFDKKYDIVGISCTTRYANWAYEIADEFRRRGVFVALGGWHPSALPDEAKAHADTVFVGESEDTWPDFLKDFEAGTPKAMYIPTKSADITNIPHPRFDIYPKNTEFGMIATRGCPYGCKYCAITNMPKRNKFRKRPIKQVIEEIKNMDNKTFSFQDNSLTIDVKYTKDLFKELKELNVNFNAYGNIKILGQDDELLKLAADAGCFSWFVGFESVSQESLNYVGKQSNKVDEYIYAVRKIHDYGMAVAGGFVLGFDYDTLDIFENTKEFADVSEIDMPDAEVLTPFPGTPIYEQYSRQGRILSRDWSKYDFRHVVFEPKNMTPEELFENTIDLNNEWYKNYNNFKRIWRSLRLGLNPAISTILQNFYLKFTREEVISNIIH